MPTPTLTEGPIDRQSQRPSTAPKLVLEPVRASSPLESHPLAVGRYLLGSSPECDIVIAVGGVAPHHCLMIVGANKTVVKAISPLTWINDGPLSEAVLKLGERLILGPVELRTRRPEVSEWIELRDEAPSPPPAPYQPPQIEVLLDHARQQLQTAIDDSATLANSLPEDLPLQKAVQIHSAITGHAAHSSALLVVQQAEQDSLNILRKELEQRELEIGERTRALEYLGTELSSRDEQLRSRESALGSQEARAQQVLTEVSQREQTLAAEEHALRVRSEAEAAASRLIAEMTRSLEDEQARLRQLDDAAQLQASELEQQAQTLAERTQTLESLEAELAARAEALQRQAQLVPVLAAVGPVDTSQVELREAVVAKRESLLANSTAALQATRDQISTEAAELELRFEELLQREQALQLRQSALTEQTSQAESRTSEVATQLAALVEREQSVAASHANLVEREATLQQLKAELDGRNRDLRGLRSELDIREEALHQQFSQLQLDRTTLRAAQSRLQLAEQAASQRLAGVEAANPQQSQAQAAELAQQRTRLEQERAEFLQERQTLEILRQQIEEQRIQWEQERSDQALLTASEVNQLESDNEWQKLAADRARLTSERRDLDEARAAFQAERHAVGTSGADSNEVSGQLLALVSERQTLAELREQLVLEQQALRAERDEIRRTRTQFDQDYEQLLAIKTESASERDTYILERQSVISERQSLQDRERQIKRSEAAIEQLRQQAEQLRTESESDRKQMDTQRVHLEEEWASLRQERAELKRAESALDVQREELTSLAQQLTDLQAGEDATTSEPVMTEVTPSTPVAAERAMERLPVLAVVPAATVAVVQGEVSVESPPELEADDEDISDPLAGFASFSSIGLAVDDTLPPEIAEIMRKAGGKPPSTPAAVQRHVTASESTVDIPPARPVPVPHASSFDSREAQRLRDLLGRSSESYMEAASASEIDEQNIYEVVQDDPEAALPTEWSGESGDEVLESPSEDMEEAEEAYAPRHDVARMSSDTAPFSSREAAEKTSTTEAGTASTELRSRLSAMFGIDLGRLRQPATPTSDEVESPAVDPDEDQQQPEFSSDVEQVESGTDEESAQADAPYPEDIEEEQEPATPPAIDESLDPVAAYMEQLLARTRKSKDAHSAKAESPAPMTAPPPVEPVVRQAEPRVPKVEMPAPSPARQTRKLEAAEKQAMRANLDSFRTIANTQARSDVARSELRRLKITEKVKQIFLAISGGIALILTTTELWTTRRYRWEMAAAVIATAFLGYDYYRTQRRLRELESIAPLEAESDDDEGTEA